MSGSMCETCVYYDYDEEYDDNVCQYELDEDEYLRFREKAVKDCPYYHFYDEYKSVRKQN